MISIDELIRIGFTRNQATVISNFFRNIGYMGKFTQEDLKEGYTIPEKKVIVSDGSDNPFKQDTQFYKDIQAIIDQKGNARPNQSGLNNTIIYQATGTDYGTDVENFVKTNGNWAQLNIDSRKPDDIEKAAAAASSNKRLFAAQTSDSTVSTNDEENIAAKLGKLNNRNTILTFHKVDTEALASGITSILAQSQLGLVDAIFSTVTSVMPQDYSASEMLNFKNLNVQYYSEVSPIEGGDIPYGSPIFYGKNAMINGEDIKARYIEFTIDLLLKAKAIDFLKKKLTYEDSSALVLDSDLSSVLLELQIGAGNQRLIKQDTETKKGFELQITPPSVLQETQPSLYATETYVVDGYYRDAKTGKVININLTVDPTDAELAQLFGT